MATIYYIPRKGGRALQVITLLADGQVHQTGELPLPPRTRVWKSSQHEDRWKWFVRLEKVGLIERTGKRTKRGISWKITKLGEAWMKMNHEDFIKVHGAKVEKIRNEQNWTN